MATQRRLKRPDFDGEKRIVWLDPDHLPSRESGRLQKQLPTRIPESLQTEFMAGVALAIQSAIWLKKTETEKTRRNQFQLVAEKSRELLKALYGVNPDGWGNIRAFSQELVFVEGALSPLSDGTKKAIVSSDFWPHAWDTTQDIESIFAHAANQLQPNKQDRPTINNARSFVAEIAKIYERITGTWPPYSKDTWFPGFIAEIGQIAGLANIGRDIVGSVIKELKTPV